MRGVEDQVVEDNGCMQDEEVSYWNDAFQSIFTN